MFPPTKRLLGRARIRKALRILGVFSLASFLFSVGPGQVDAAAAGCPDLTGTYQAVRPAWMDEFHLHVTETLRPRVQSPQFATLSPRKDGYLLVWHMPREDVLKKARSLSDRDPNQYVRWLDLVLRTSYPVTRVGSMEQSWYNQIAGLGPLHQVTAVLPLKECEAGWIKVDTHGRNGPADFDGGVEGTRDVTLWLRKDADGSLGLKWVERRKIVLLSGRYVRETSIPLWSSTHSDKWPPAPAADLSPLREEELPPRIRPKGKLLKCQLDPEQTRQFFARLKANLPEKAEHVNAAVSHYQGRIRPDDTCELMPFFVTVVAKNAADMSVVEALLKADPFFVRMDSKDSVPRTDGRLQVAFKMLLVPE